MISVLTSGSYFLHRAYLKNYKKEFKSYISKHKKETTFTVININSNELYVNSTSINWEDDNKEVVYKGILYDIVSVQKVGTIITLTVVSDQQEMELKKQFASIYDVNSKTTTKHPLELLKNFFALKYVINDSDIQFNNTTSSCPSLISNLLFQITTMFLSQEAPPPDFCI